MLHRDPAIWPWEGVSPYSRVAPVSMKISHTEQVEETTPGDTLPEPLDNGSGNVTQCVPHEVHCVRASFIVEQVDQDATTRLTRARAACVRRVPTFDHRS